MNILDEIIVKKKERLEIRKGQLPLYEIREKIADTYYGDDFRKNRFKNSLIGKKKAIIAEIKKASPSAGIISKNFDPIKIARRYKTFGASALSILTEEDYFLGKIAHHRQVKWHSNVNLPILRKDFIFDKYQIWESAMMGSDCILLIASLLNDKQLEEFAVLAESLQLDYIIMKNGRNYTLPLFYMSPDLGRSHMKTSKQHPIFELTKEACLLWWTEKRDEYSLKDFFTYGKSNDLVFKFREGKIINK